MSGVTLQGDAQRIRVLAIGDDRGVAGQVAMFLADAGLAVQPAEADGPVDGVVVLMSQAALLDPAWRERTNTIGSGRLVVVRIGALEDGIVPELLARPNWLDWNAEHPAATMGALLAGLLADPERRRLARELTNEAFAWATAGRPNRLLMSDHRRAQRMSAVLADIENDPLAHPGAFVPAFVQTSLKVTRRQWRKTRRRRATAAIVLLIALVAGLGSLAAIKAASHSNKEAIVTSGEAAIIAQLPEWSGANAGALLATGTAAEQALARATMLQAFAEPWDSNTLDFLRNTISLQPFDGGARAVALGLTATGGRTLAIMTLPQGRLLFSRQLTEAYTYVGVTPDGASALAVGSNLPLVKLNLKTRALTTVRGPGAVDGAEQLNDGRIVLAPSSTALDVLDPAIGAVTSVGRYRNVIAIDATTAPSGTALVSEAGDRVAIVDAADGRTLASGTVALAADPQGAIAPGGREAVVTGADGQLWLIGPRGATRTGIPVPGVIEQLLFTMGDRVVVASSDEYAQVYLLSRSELLGTICNDAAALHAVAVDPGGTTAICLGAETTVWSLPPDPIAVPASGLSSNPSTAGPTASVSASGATMTILLRGALGRSTIPDLDPLQSPITAAHVSPDGRSIVVGAADGSAAIIGLTPAFARVVSRWHAPDGAAIRSVGWSSRPVAVTTSGQAWPVPDCPDCTTDAGLLAELRRRETGCLTARQLAFIDTSVWRRIGLSECPPVGPYPPG